MPSICGYLQYVKSREIWIALNLSPFFFSYNYASYYFNVENQIELQFFAYTGLVEIQMYLTVTGTTY